MSEKTFYHPSAGVWVSIGTPSNEALTSFPDGTVEIPARPSVMHKWNGTAWVPPTATEISDLQARNNRQLRDDTLRYQVDPIVSNPLRWAAMSEAEQLAWSTYRQALLDITSQSGFPSQVNWPQAPDGALVQDQPWAISTSTTAASE